MNITLKLAKTTQKTWQENSISERVIYLQNLQRILLKNKETYARLITTEMHKPITQAIAEVEKCALLCDYYLENASFLKMDNLNFGYTFNKFNNDISSIRVWTGVQNVFTITKFFK